MDKHFKYPKYRDPRKKFRGAFYDREKQEWRVIYSQNPELNIWLQDIKGVYQKDMIYRPD